MAEPADGLSQGVDAEAHLGEGASPQGATGIGTGIEPEIQTEIEREIEREIGSEIESETERRRSLRTPLVVRVSYSTVDALFSEFTRNINEGGLFIETESPPPPDTRVALEFRLPGCESAIQAHGRVAWVREARGDEPAGMGVEFDSLGSDARRHIDALVRALRSPR